MIRNDWNSAGSVCVLNCPVPLSQFHDFVSNCKAVTDSLWKNTCVRYNALTHLFTLVLIVLFAEYEQIILHSVLHKSEYDTNIPCNPQFLLFKKFTEQCNGTRVYFISHMFFVNAYLLQQKHSPPSWWRSCCRSSNRAVRTRKCALLLCPSYATWWMQQVLVSHCTLPNISVYNSNVCLSSHMYYVVVF